MAQVRIFLALFLILFFTPLLARGDVGDLGVLRTEQRKAAAALPKLKVAATHWKSPPTKDHWNPLTNRLVVY